MEFLTMTKNTIDKGCQTQSKFLGECLKKYQLRPRNTVKKFKKDVRAQKQNKSTSKKILKLFPNSKKIKKNPSKRPSLEGSISNSNRSSSSAESPGSKSTNVFSSDEEGSFPPNRRTTSLSLNAFEISGDLFKAKRPYSCPSSLRKDLQKSPRLPSTERNPEMKKVDEENYSQRVGGCLSDVILRQKESCLKIAHQSTSDKGLKLRIPRKRSIRTSLKDVLSPPKSKRRLIENSNQNLRDEGENFLDLCSGSVEPTNNTEAYKTVMVQHGKQKEKLTVKEKILRDSSIKENKLPDGTLELKTSNLEKNKLGPDFEARDEIIFEKALELVGNLQGLRIINRGEESDLNTEIVRSGGDKQEAPGLLSKMEEIVGTNEDAVKNDQDPEPGVERKVDRFRNLLEKISMQPGDVTILLEDAAKNDKTLEFLGNLRNLSRSSNPQARERFLLGEDKNEEIISDLSQIQYQNYSGCNPLNYLETEHPSKSQIECPNNSQTEAQNNSQTEAQNNSQIEAQTEYQKFSQTKPQCNCKTRDQNKSQLKFQNIAQFESLKIRRTEHQNYTPTDFQNYVLIELQSYLQTRSQNDSQTEDQSSSQIKLQNSSQNSSQIESQNSSQIESRNSSQIEPQNSQIETQNSSQIESQNSSQIESQNISQIGSQNFSQIESQNSSQIEFQNSCQIEPQNSSQIETQNSFQIESQNSSQIESQSSSQIETQNPSQIESQNSSQIESQNSSQIESQNSPQIEPQIDTQSETQNNSEIQSNSQIEPQRQLEPASQNEEIHKSAHQSEESASAIDEDDDIQILKVITNKPNFHHKETNYRDGDYHFLMSLYQQLEMMPEGRKLKMRLKMQQLFCEELCTVDSD